MSGCVPVSPGRAGDAACLQEQGRSPHLSAQLPGLTGRFQGASQALQAPFVASLDATGPCRPPCPGVPIPVAPQGNYGPAAPLQEQPHPDLTLSSWPRRPWGQQPGPRGGRSTPSTLLAGRSRQQVTAPGSLCGWPSWLSRQTRGAGAGSKCTEQNPQPGAAAAHPRRYLVAGRAELSRPVPSRPAVLQSRARPAPTHAPCSFQTWPSAAVSSSSSSSSQ